MIGDRDLGEKVRRIEQANAAHPRDHPQYATLHAIDLIVMATHGRSGVRRWLLGSVAEKVSRASPQPVMLVRPAPPAGG